MRGLKDSKIKIVSGIIAMMMLLYIVFSTFFISLEANHKCEDEENCPICVCMQICQNTLHQISDFTAVAVVSFVPVLLCVGVSFVISDNLVKETPVTNKIRLNN
jgi:hypothetical protein